MKERQATLGFGPVVDVTGRVPPIRFFMRSKNALIIQTLGKFTTPSFVATIKWRWGRFAP